MSLFCFRKIIARCLLAGGVIFFCLSCGAPSEAGKPGIGPAEEPAALSASDTESPVYLLFLPEYPWIARYSRAEEFRAALAASDLPSLPWVEQIRVVDFLKLKTRTYLSVNRLGVGRILPGMEGAELFSGGRLFDRRVLGSSLVQGEGIVCQLFSDSVFCDYVPNTLPPLVFFSPETGGFSSLPLEGAAGGWELAELSVREGDWYLGWKAPVGEARFRYGRIPGGTDREEEIPVEAYRSVLVPGRLEEAPPELASLIRHLETSPAPDRVIGVRIASGVPDPGTLYLTASPEALNRGSYRELVAGYAGDRWLVLDPDAFRIYREGRGTGPGEMTLPSLPEGCVYTGFAVEEDRLILSWEEQAFPLVRGAGLVFSALNWGIR